MHKLILLAAPLALAACAQEATVEEPVAEETAAAEEALTTANGTAVPLVVDVADEDGPVGVTTLNADGTYQDVGVDGEVQSEGTWEIVDGKSCFTDDDGVTCWTESEPAEDGSFTVTSDEGAVQTVKPVTSE